MAAVIAVVLVAWLLLSLPVALWICAAIRHADKKETHTC